MYFKIEDQKSKLYKELKELRLKELKQEKQNEFKLAKFIGIDDCIGYGYKGGGWHRLYQYAGFGVAKADRLTDEMAKYKGLKEEKQGDYYVYTPYLRTKKGRAFKEFLVELNKTSGCYLDVAELLSLDFSGKFFTPQLYFANDLILLAIDDRYCKELQENKDLIEITTKEINEHLSKGEPTN